MIRYLTGASTPAVRAIARARSIGIMVTPDTCGEKSRARYHLHLADYPEWAADNACFARPESFDVDTFLAWLAAFTPEQRATCLFAVAPDVVQNAEATFARSLPVLPRIRALGFRAAFVAQDGLENMEVPWDAFDALFIGGSTDWKLSFCARALCVEAKRRGKHVHMGRVNSLRRMRIAESFGCDTADGTYLAFGPAKNLPRLLSWLDVLEQEHAA